MDGKVINFKKKKKINYILISFVILAVAAIFLFRFLGNPFLGFKRGHYGERLELDSASSYASAKYTGGVALFGKDGIRGISNTGRIAWTVDFSSSQPVLIASGEYLLAAERNGKALKLIKGGREKCSLSIDGNMIACNVNRNGYFVVVSTERGYKAKVTAYDKKGQSLYTWHSAENNVISCAISDSGKIMALSVLNSENPKEISNVMIFDIKGDDIVTAAANENNLISNVIFYGNKILAVGDRGSIYYSYSGEIRKTIDYKGRTLQEFSCYSDGILAMGFNKIDNGDYHAGSVVEVYDSNGKMTGSARTDSDISFLDTYGRYVLVNTESGVSVINSGGDVVSNAELTSGAFDAYMCGSRNRLFLMSGTVAGIYIL